MDYQYGCFRIDLIHYADSEFRIGMVAFSGNFRLTNLNLLDNFTSYILRRLEIRALLAIKMSNSSGANIMASLMHSETARRRRNS